MAAPAGRRPAHQIYAQNTVTEADRAPQGSLDTTQPLESPHFYGGNLQPQEEEEDEYSSEIETAPPRSRLPPISPVFSNDDEDFDIPPIRRKRSYDPYDPYDPYDRHSSFPPPRRLTPSSSFPSDVPDMADFRMPSMPLPASSSFLAPKHPFEISVWENHPVILVVLLGEFEPEFRAALIFALKTALRWRYGILSFATKVLTTSDQERVVQPHEIGTGDEAFRVLYLVSTDWSAADKSTVLHNQRETFRDAMKSVNWQPRRFEERMFVISRGADRIQRLIDLEFGELPSLVLDPGDFIRGLKMQDTLAINDFLHADPLTPVQQISRPKLG